MRKEKRNSQDITVVAHALIGRFTGDNCTVLPPIRLLAPYHWGRLNNP